ncbi:enoyl-ACP reductase FabV [Saccharospirillum salsuginis]|uniref:Enoyl-[acyl-carrier-protein] reductase [NADH] n=1 Tax=Saccharospirillum salsuginis TaxID=418750 RepID=A0A918K972_9GAMM|nr:enoyl-ACP reductase FabV [Saccharospirillum salsuginis]GGX53259.1 enoyl-[acyl-carrier-protein] reductase [NADH] [Saccharospirillum salsuginis]
MIIKPKVRGFICTTAHPEGCKVHVQEQIDYVKAHKPAATGPKNVLIIGCSNGYGLASRISAAFGHGAKTLGVMFEKEPTERRPASAGWYNTKAFEAEAEKEGLYAKSLNADAFSDDAKAQVIDVIKNEMGGQVDLVVYSLGAPRRTDPETGQTYASSLKAIGEPVTRKSLNTDTKQVGEFTLDPATDEEIHNTIKVMGGEDWERWIDQLSEAGVLAEGVKSTAYSYIGKDLTWPIYGGATIGRAKQDVDRASVAINEKLKKELNGEANVSVLKAVVTQSSSAIPVMPLYLSILIRVMKERGTNEGCIEQVHGLLTDQLYGSGDRTLDDQGRIRMDLNELDSDVQAEVEAIWNQVNSDNVDELTDFAEYQKEFFKLFGFGFDEVDYEKDVDPIV